jgi:hypothetical protein
MKTKLISAALSFVLMCVLLANAQSPARSSAKKPNILIIWGDDIGIHNINAYNLGVMGYHTPNIARLAIPIPK